MVLIRKQQSACVTSKNMQKMQSLNCQRYCISGSSSSGHCQRRQMWVVGVILLLTTIIFTVNAEQSYAPQQRYNDGQLRTHFVSDDNLQAKLPAGSTDAQRHSPKFATYKKELAGCSHTAKKLMLSLILQKNNWDDIIDSKRDRALNKLSKLFGVPKDLMVTTNIIQRDITEMEKYSLQKGQHTPTDRKRYAKLEFVIGCSDYFTTGNTIAKRISRQMEENLISETSGLNFDWWCIWEKQANYRTPRSKRDADANNKAGVDSEAGSGDEEYYYDDDNDDESAVLQTEKPIDEHPHRHHHGDETPMKKERNEKLVNEKLSKFDSTESMAKPVDRVIDLEAVQHQQQQHQHQYQQQRLAKSKPPPPPKIETQTLAGEQSSIQEEVTQLKSVITKTIENNNENVKEVEQELEKIANERKAATERVILTDAFDTPNSNSRTNDFEPIVETFSEDDAIVIKPKQTIDEQRRQAVAAETSENDYVIEDNTIKNHGGKLATVDIDNEQQQINQKSMGFAAAAVTNRPNEPLKFTSNEFDDRNHNHNNPNNNNNNFDNKGFDDITIGLDTPKPTLDVRQPSLTSSSSSSIATTTITAQESSAFVSSVTSMLTTLPRQNIDISESQAVTSTTTTTTAVPSSAPTSSIDSAGDVVAAITVTPTTTTTTTSIGTTLMPIATTTTATATIVTSSSPNMPISITNRTESIPSRSDTITTASETILHTTTSEVTPLTKVTVPAKNNVLYQASTVLPNNIDTVEQVTDTQPDYDEMNYKDFEDQETAKVSVVSSAVTTTPPVGVLDTTTPDRSNSIGNGGISAFGGGGTTIYTSQPTTILTTTPPTSPATTTTTTTPIPTTTEYIEPENVNNAPMIKARLVKLAVTAGKPFNHIVPLETFYDNEDGTNLKLELLDKFERPLEAKSWIQFNAETRNIYGLPLEDAVSKWQFKLRATDTANASVVETLDISVQQHKSYRSVNHEILINVELLSEFASNVDWEMRLIKGIVDILGDTSSVLVRDIQPKIQDPNSALFIYTNESLPKDVCAESQLNEITTRLTTRALNAAVSPQMAIKSIEGRPVGTCSKPGTIKPTAPKPTPHLMKNYSPMTRNQIDRVNATMNQLLVFKVPQDTFYDTEDGTDLKLSLLTYERNELDPKYWLQFDSKNQEFYGIPKHEDVGQREYVLVAEDREGKQATDALVVVVSRPNTEHNNAFEFTLNIPFEDFNNSLTQRRFVERIASIFGDPTTSNIQLRSIRKIHHPPGMTHVTFFNTTLFRPHNVCPTEEIDALKNILMRSDGSIRERVKKIIGNEFDLQKIHLAPRGPCLPGQENHVHRAGVPNIKPDAGDIIEKDDNLLTIVLPAVIILSMLFLTCIIACILYRKRSTGKLELGKYGDEEERRSFRSKGIPVIFQDELDEKPEIGNKSPIILKDEKPPLLPPSYNSTNPDDHEDLEDYLPPPDMNRAMSGRESRGKSPVTPSYRKPPPYVSP